MSRPSSRPRARTPAADLLHHTLVDSTESYRKCRIILDAELKRISTQLDRTDLVPAQRAEYLMQLLEVQRVLGQDVKSIGQLVTVKPTAGSTDSSSGGVPTSDEILREIIQGKKSCRGKV
jgi:hypothetical protein